MAAPARLISKGVLGAPAADLGFPVSPRRWATSPPDSSAGLILDPSGSRLEAADAAALRMIRMIQESLLADLGSRVLLSAAISVQYAFRRYAGLQLSLP